MYIYVCICLCVYVCVRACVRLCVCKYEMSKRNRNWYINQCCMVNAWGGMCTLFSPRLSLGGMCSIVHPLKSSVESRIYGPPYSVSNLEMFVSAEEEERRGTSELVTGGASIYRLAENEFLFHQCMGCVSSPTNEGGRDCWVVHGVIVFRGRFRT